MPLRLKMLNIFNLLFHYSTVKTCHKIPKNWKTVDINWLNFEPSCFNINKNKREHISNNTDAKAMAALDFNKLKVTGCPRYLSQETFSCPCKIGKCREHYTVCRVYVSCRKYTESICKLGCSEWMKWVPSHIFTGRQRSCKPCISYDRDVRLSIRLSVRLSHAGTEWKRRKLGSRNLHRRIAQGL